MARPRKDPARADGAVREQVLAAALQLFIERGYAATTVREIVETAGVSKPVLYYYFGSKAGIYREIMDGIGQLFDQRIAGLHSTAGTARQRLLHLFTGMFDSASANLPVVRLAYAIYFGPPQGAPFVDFNRFFDQLLDLVEALIGEGTERGEFGACDQQALAWSLLGSYHTILEEQFCRTAPRIGRTGLCAVIEQILDGAAAGAGRNIRSTP